MFTAHTRKVLMIFVEPTPYILDILHTLESSWSGEIDVLFLKENFSQKWHLSLDTHYVILPKKKFACVKLLYQQFFQKKYQLISMAGWSHPWTLISILLAKIFRIPVVVDSDTPILPNITRWKRFIKRLLYPPLFKLPNIFLPSGTRQAYYLKQYGVPDHKIILQKMTVDVVGIQNAIRALSIEYCNNLREKMELSKNDCIFLFSGRLIERKGVREILQAFSDMQHPIAKCIMVGDGPLKSPVEYTSKKMPRRVLYFGWLEKQALLDLYAISDVVILPAYFEPWGLVINEAMAAGKPVIVTDEVGCVDDLVIPEKTGIIIKPRSVNALTNAIIYLTDHVAVRKNMSQHALAHIAHWTLQDEAAQITLAWRKALSD